MPVDPPLHLDDRHLAGFLTDVLEVLTKVDLANRVDGKPGASYALQPRALEVGHAEATVTCDGCPFEMSTTTTGAEQLDGVACFRENCTGVLHRGTMLQ